MIIRIFGRGFFEKSRYLIMYSLSIVTFWYVLFIRVFYVACEAHYQETIPDIEIYGEKADFADGYMLYYALDTSVQDKLSVEGVKSYRLAVRNLYTFSDAYYQVSYRIYGAEEEFLQELSSYLRRGRLPETGKTEAVIGSNVAEYYDLTVGDVLNVPITLDENIETVSHEYVVTGIISSDFYFYSNGIYISKETYESLEHPVTENTIYIYSKTKKNRSNIIRQLESESKSGSIGGIIRHYEIKVSLQDTILAALIKTVPFSAVVLTVLFLSLMKYTSRKIGLMKALGISDKHIMRMLMKGFGLMNFMIFATSFLSIGTCRLTIDFSLPFSIILYSVFSFTIIFLITMIIIFILCKRIPSRSAMYSY